MELKERILVESSRLFLSNGIKSITMDEIAKTLGISKRTLYENYADKEALLHASFSYFLECKQREQRLLEEKVSNSIEVFLVFHSFVVSGLENISRTYFRELKRYYPNIYKQFDEQSEENIKAQIEMLRRGQDDGLIRVDLNPEITALLVKVQFEMLWHSDIFTMRNYTLKEVLATIILNYVRGIATPAGLKIIDEYIERTKNK